MIKKSRSEQKGMGKQGGVRKNETKERTVHKQDFKPSEFICYTNGIALENREADKDVEGGQKNG
jgi:hypothetical protein